MKAYEDTHNIGNSEKYHTGLKCINDACQNKAGTAWSPYWCQPCNAKRIDKISATLEDMINENATV